MARKCRYTTWVHVQFRTTLTSSQGLEEFKLVEKMGDGAFSNVFKAIERKTGRKVAVKVVRKYELNSSQVRFILYSTLGVALGHLPLSLPLYILRSS